MHVHCIYGRPLFFLLQDPEEGKWSLGFTPFMLMIEWKQRVGDVLIACSNSDQVLQVWIEVRQKNFLLRG